MNLRPSVSNSLPSRSGPREISRRERQNVPADAVGRHAVEIGQDQRVGEEDGIVEECLRRHQGQAHERSPRIGAKQCPGDFEERRMSARAQSHSGVARPRVVARRSRSALDLRHDSLRALRISVQHQPSRALGNPKPHDEDHRAERRSDQESQTPTDRRIDDGWIEQHDRAGRAHRGADPEAAVDGEVGPAAHAGRNELLYGRIDRRVLSADAGPGQQAKNREAPEVPRQRGGGGRREVDRDCDEKELLAAETIRQPSEEQGAQDRSAQIGAAGAADLGIAQAQGGAFLEDAGQRARQGDLEPVQDPGDAERDHHQGVEAAPGEAIEARRDVGLDDRGQAAAPARRVEPTRARAAAAMIWRRPRRGSDGSLSGPALIVPSPSKPTSLLTTFCNIDGSGWRRGGETSAVRPARFVSGGIQLGWASGKTEYCCLAPLAGACSS